MKIIKKILVIMLMLTLTFNLSVSCLAAMVEQEKEEEETVTKEQLGGASEETQKTEIENKIETIDKKKYITVLDTIFENEMDDVEEILQKFQYLGILKESDSFNLSEAATRGEVAYIAAKLYNGGKDVTDTPNEYEFKDVSEEHPYYNEIALLLNHHIIGGYEDGTYRPDEPISRNDALSIIVKVMGYEAMSDYFGDVYTGLISVANKLRLTEVADSDESGFLTKMGMLKLINKALDTEIAEITSIVNNDVQYASTGETVLSKYFDLICVSGAVTANDRTSIFSKSGAVKENSVQIGEYVISFDESIDASAYLGMNVDAYCKKDNTKQGVYIKINDNRMKRTRILANDILRYDSGNNIIEYKINDEKTKTHKFNSSISIIFNGSAVDGNLVNEMFTPDVGELSFIDNNGDGKDDILFIDSFATYVSYYSGSAVYDIIADKHGVQPQIKISDVENIVYYKDDVKVTISDINPDNVLLIQSDYVTYNTHNGKRYMVLDTANSDYYRVIATGDAIQNSLGSLNNKNEITLGDTLVKMSKYYNTVSDIGKSPYIARNINVGRDVVIGIDAYGNGGYISEAAEAVKYGYITGIIPNGTFADGAMVKIFTSDGEFITPVTADKISLYKQWSGSSVNEGNYYAQRISGNEILQGGSVSELWNGTAVKEQLIKYGVDSSGKLNKLYIAGNDTTDYKTTFPENTSLNTFAMVKDFSGTNNIYVLNFGFDGMYSIKNSTVGFQVPSISGADDNYYQVLTEVPYGNGSSVADAKIYDMDRSGNVGAFVRTVNAAVDPETGITIKANSYYKTFAIADIENTWSQEKGELVTRISIYEKSGRDSAKMRTLTATSSELKSNATPDRPETHKIPIKDLNPGDLIIIEENALGEIGGFKIVWRNVATDVSKPEDIPYGEYQFSGLPKVYDTTDYNATTNRINAGENFYGGEIKYIYENGAYVDTGLRKADGTVIYRKITASAAKGGNHLFMYDMNEKSLIQTNLINARVGDYIYWHQISQLVNGIVIIRRN